MASKFVTFLASDVLEISVSFLICSVGLRPTALPANAAIVCASTVSVIQ
jgi:hypothetical protein